MSYYREYGSSSDVLTIYPPKNLDEVVVLLNIDFIDSLWPTMRLKIIKRIFQLPLQPKGTKQLDHFF